MPIYQPDPSQRSTPNDIETPESVSIVLHHLLKKHKPKIILDPACGRGNLLKPWLKSARCLGVEIDLNRTLESRKLGIECFLSPFENFSLVETTKPDLILCNPPWSGHWSNANYTEIFVRRIITLFGADIPLVLLCPMGFTLNQRFGSKRAKWLSETLKITSVVACPVNLYPTVEFHSQILFFNIPRMKPFYWLEQELNAQVSKKNRHKYMV